MEQAYHAYTAIEQQTWATLYNRQSAAIEQVASKHFINGIARLGFSATAIPDFNEINRTLGQLNRWSIYAVPGLIDNKYFFEQMQERRFGATTWMRTPEQLDYLEEPDMFHDVFGHVPLLADPATCEWLHALARIAGKHIHRESVIEAIARVYWYTVEFGLVREASALKIYGAGILSSIGETACVFSGKPRLLPFDIYTIMNTPYIRDSYQQQYFVLASINELQAAVPLMETYFERTAIF